MFHISLRQYIRAFDRHVGDSVHDWPKSVCPVLFAFTAIGEPVVTIGLGVVVAVIGVLQDQPQLIGGGSLVVATLIITSIIKQFFRRARPARKFADALWLDTYSFPSGHSSGSVVAYGVLAMFLWTNDVYVVAALTALAPVFVGFSRIYLRVHYPSDVVGGWLLGLLGLFTITTSAYLW